MGTAAILQWYISHLNYFTIVLLMAIESSFIPLPSEIVIPPAAWKAGADSDLNIFLVVIFATIGADLGALINYGLAHWLGRPLVYKFANSRLGHFFFLNQEKVEHSEKFFVKHGALSTFIGRLVPGVRHLISIPAGLSRMHLRTFIMYTTIGAFIWNVILAAIGYYLSTIPSINTVDKLLAQVNKYSATIGHVIIALAVALVVALLLKSKLKKKKVTAE